MAALTLLSACSTKGYAFKVDESIDIISPKARSTVELPVTITWVDGKVGQVKIICFDEEDESLSKHLFMSRQ